MCADDKTVEPTSGGWFEPSTARQAQRCLDDWQGEGCRFLRPTPVMEQAMARCGVVRFEVPTFLTTRTAEPAFDDAWTRQAGLDDDEVLAVAEIGEAFRDALYRDVTALVVEIGKSEAWARQTPLMGMMMALHEEVDDDEGHIKAIFERIAQERAGLLEPPPASADLSVHERFVRRIAEVGPAFERALAVRLGRARAQQLRQHADGWPGSRVQTRSQCDE
jgi:hypothetical protein